MSKNFLPLTDATQDLGIFERPWNEVHANSLNFSAGQKIILTSVTGINGNNPSIEFGLDESDKPILIFNNEDTIYIPGTDMPWGEEAFVITANIISSGQVLNLATAGYNSMGTQAMPYSWKINWGDGVIETKSGTSAPAMNLISHTYSSPNTYKIVITPVSDAYGWMRAFTNIDPKIISFDYLTNKSFMISASTHGPFYMAYLCNTSSTTQPITEVKTVDETSVVTIAANFKFNQYYGCAQLLTAEIEQIPSGVQNISSNFKQAQYKNCTNLQNAAEESLPTHVVNIANGFRKEQYSNCTSLLIGNYVHARMDEFLNGGNNNFELMFNMPTTKSTSDSIPKFKDKLNNIYPITDLTPSFSKQYCTNRTGISGYASLNANWK